MNPQPQRETRCPRCAATVPPAMRSCPKCGLAIQPGVAYFDSAGQARPEEPESDAKAVGTHERKVITCLPMDLERVARAEAVDGWALADTTVDPEIAGNIRAHFRRTLRTDRPAAEARAGTDRKTAQPAKPAPQKGQARRPDFGPEPSPTPELRALLVFLLVLGTIVFLAENLGGLGIILALLLVPKLLRSLAGTRKRRGPRR